MISYQPTHVGESARVEVYLDNKLVGHIEHLFNGLWQYWPKGPRAEGGEQFHTLRLCQRSLEGDANEI